MRLAVLAAADPLDINAWSGTPYFMTKALQEQFPDLLAVHAPRRIWFQYLRRASVKVTAGRVDLYWNYSLARWHARQIAALLKAERIDVAVRIANSSLTAFVAARLPTIHVSDGG